MKKVVNIILEDEQIVNLMRILIDEDAEDALAFQKTHFEGKARELMERG